MPAAVNDHLIIRRFSSEPAPMAGPLTMLADFVRHRHLIVQLTWRDVLGRYRGSYLGILWSFINPILLLGIFTFVFKYIFNARFNLRPGEGPGEFALSLFAALVIFNVFAECLARAPTLMLLNSSYVSRVVFPLEILPITVVLAAVVHLVIAFVPLCLAIVILRSGGIPATALFWPLLFVPIVFWALAFTWVISAFGAFVRDLNDLVVAVTTILMYASAVFYPLKLLIKAPPIFRTIVGLNPLAYFSEESRRLMVLGGDMEWVQFGWITGTGALAMLFAYMIFMRLKSAFADVI